MTEKELSIEELATDEKFIQWVKQPTPESELLWQEWAGKNPLRKEKIEIATNVIKALEFQDIETSEDDKMDIWSKMSENMHVNEGLSLWKKVLIGAIVVLLSLSAVAFYQFINSSTTHVTDFAELKHIDLPDGSKTILNANSSLTYKRKWKEGEVRKIELLGEAYFDVQHISSQDRFVVETKNVDVQVIGTQFVVNSRDYGAQITLEEGEIHLLDNLTQERLKVMKPGQTGFYDVKTTRFNLEPKNIKIHTSWKSGEFAFDQTPVSEIIRIIKETYGYNVKINDDQIWDTPISGTIEAVSIDHLLRALEGILNVDITRNKKAKLVYFN